MKAYRKYDNKEIDVTPYYINNQLAGYVEKRANGVRRFYYHTSIQLKEYYGN